MYISSCEVVEIGGNVDYIVSLMYCSNILIPARIILFLR